ncbi:MAG TPA: MFS transporter [Streptosporangiales bacterium]
MSRLGHVGRERLLLWLGICLVALNLRPLVSGLGPVLTQVRADLHLSGALAGVITTLPVVCFGVFGSLAPPIAARVGIRRLTLVAMLAVAVGLVVRVVSGSGLVFVLGSTLALAAIGFANVLIPTLVKLHFPRQIGLVTGVYTTLLQLSTAIAAAVSVPMSAALGGWREGLGVWALVAVVAAVPWLGLLRERVALRPAVHRVTWRGLSHSPTAWLLAVFFGIQSANAYAQLGWLPALFTDAGVSKTGAGYALAVIPAVGVVVSVVLAALTARLRSFRPVVVTLCVCYAVGYLGVLVVPATVPWLWSLLLGVGGGTFPVSLMLIGLRARTGQGSSALSGFVQGIGYLVAAAVPFLIGVLHDATRSWTAAVAVLLGSVALLFLAGLGVTRVRYVEDEIGTDRPEAA